MDTRLTNDGKPYRESSPRPHREPTLKHKPITSIKGAWAFLAVLLVLCVTVCVADELRIVANKRTYKQYRAHELYFQPTVHSDDYVLDQAIRYAKNLNRRYIYFKDFALDAENSVTEKEYNEYLNKSKSELIKKEIEIEDEFRSKAQDLYYINSFIVSEDVPGDGYGSGQLYESQYQYESYEDSIKQNTFLFDEKDRKIEELRAQYIKTPAEVRRTILKEKEENYSNIENYLSNTYEFKYYLTNEKASEVYTNIPQNEDPLEYMNSKCLSYISIDSYMLNTQFNGEFLVDTFKAAGISGYIMIPMPVHRDLGEPHDEPSHLSRSIDGISYKINAPDNVYELSAMLAILLIIMLLLLFIAIKYQRGATARLISLFYQKLYLNVPLVIKGIFCIVIFIGIHHWSWAWANGWNASSSMADKLLLISATLLLMSMILHIWNVLRNFRILAREPEIRFIKYVAAQAGMIYKQRNKALSVSMTMLLLGVIIFEIYVLFVAALNSTPELFLIDQIFIIPFFIMGYSLISALAKMNDNMLLIEAGTYETYVGKGIYKSVINKLNTLGTGIDVAVNEKLRSQRLKTELITNVSHDLKTPLTSIINYVELLKHDGLSEQEQREYVDVIDKKSQRLKVLIEDLFEATKLSSGQIAIETQPVDLVDLLRQAMGELSEKFNAANISLRFHPQKDHIFLSLDGKRIWRVFENLLTNIYKYAQPGTRAHISIEEGESSVQVIFKNTSAYELNFQSDEFFERFKRGDIARSTEGSGLGLSIARSIVELHGGSINIVIDGDLFKAIVTLPGGNLDEFTLDKIIDDILGLN